MMRFGKIFKGLYFKPSASASVFVVISDRDTRMVIALTVIRNKNVVRHIHFIFRVALSGRNPFRGHMHSLVLYILAVFAVYRTARMIALEDGPGNVFQDIRGSLMRTPTWVQVGATCPLCLGFWLALVPALLIGLPSPLAVLGLWFAIAGGQAFLWDLVQR